MIAVRRTMSTGPEPRSGSPFIRPQSRRGYDPLMQVGRARVAVRDATARLLRSLLLWLSRRRFLGRIAVAMPLTRSLVGRFVAGQTLEGALPALEQMHVAGYRTTVDV